MLLLPGFVLLPVFISSQLPGTFTFIHYLDSFCYLEWFYYLYSFYYLELSLSFTSFFYLPTSLLLHTCSTSIAPPQLLLLNCSTSIAPPQLLHLNFFDPNFFFDLKVIFTNKIC